MASLQELNSYTGNAALGGGTQGNQTSLGVPDFPHTFDAVDRLTAYTMQVNRDMWAQSNLKVQQQAQEAAKALDITYGNLIPEDRTLIDDAVADLYKFYDKNPNAVRYTIDPATGRSNKEAYGEFMQKKERLDHLIVRGNIRANQLYGVQGEISKQTDPRVIERMNQQLLNERKKPIGENILIPPNPSIFNWSSYIDGKAPFGQQETSFVQRFPNDILDVTMKMFDPIKASLAVVNDLNGNTPVSEDLKKNLAQQKILVDQILGANTVADGNGNQVLDRKKLESDPNAIPLLNQIKFYNDYVDKLNSTEVVENGTKTRKKVREFMGYPSDIAKVDVSNLSDMDLVRLGLTYKAGVSTDVKPIPTDNAIQMRGQDLNYKEAMARLGWDKDKFWYTVNQGKQGEENIADEKLMQYYNLMTAPSNGMGGMGKYEVTYDKAGNVKEKKELGYEIGLSPQLVEAFSIPATKSKTKTKATDGTGGLVNTNSGFTETETETSSKRPTRIFVVPDKSGDPNKNRVQVKYEDNTVQDFSSSQVFSAFNRLFGPDEKIQSKVSEVAMRRLAKWGLSQPDVNAIGQKLGNLQQGTDKQTGPQQTAPAPAKGKKPRPY